MDPPPAEIVSLRPLLFPIAAMDIFLVVFAAVRVRACGTGVPIFHVESAGVADVPVVVVFDRFGEWLALLLCLEGLARLGIC